MQEIKVNSLKAWFLAARPKTLTGAAIPVLLAGALAVRVGAFAQHDLADGAVPFGSTGLHVALWVSCLLFACWMQIAANLINDLFDYLKGSDRDDRLGPERACAQGWITPGAMKTGIAVVLSVACVVGLLAVMHSRHYLPLCGMEYIVMGVLCVVFAFLYTTRLSYMGWGDALVLVFFGFVPVCGTYYMQTLNITTSAVLLSLIAGIAIDALLMINNYRDCEQDRISGKKTVVVRLGKAFGSRAYLAIGVVVTLLSVVLVCLLPGFSLGRTSALLCLLLLVYLVLHVRTWQKMCRIGQGKALNIILGETSRNMFLMAICLSIVIIFV